MVAHLIVAISHIYFSYCFVLRFFRYLCTEFGKSELKILRNMKKRANKKWRAESELNVRYHSLFSPLFGCWKSLRSAQHNNTISNIFLLFPFIRDANYQCAIPSLLGMQQNFHIYILQNTRSCTLHTCSKHGMYWISDSLLFRFTLIWMSFWVGDKKTIKNQSQFQINQFGLSDEYCKFEFDTFFCFHFDILFIQMESCALLDITIWFWDFFYHLKRSAYFENIHKSVIENKLFFFALIKSAYRAFDSEWSAKELQTLRIFDGDYRSHRCKQFFVPTKNMSHQTTHRERLSYIAARAHTSTHAIDESAFFICSKLKKKWSKKIVTAQRSCWRGKKSIASVKKQQTLVIGVKQH